MEQVFEKRLPWVQHKLHHDIFGSNKQILPRSKEAISRFFGNKCSNLELQVEEIEFANLKTGFMCTVFLQNPLTQN